MIPRAVEQVIVELVEELGAGHRIWSVGIGAAGWMDLDGGTVLFSPHWPGAMSRLRDNLQRLLRRPVLLTNDADAAGWAEWRFGAGQGQNRLVCITLGTGIGGAMVMDGRLERGRFGVAGEFGHQIIMPGGHRCECGNRGCWEQYASGNALGREARELAAANSPVAQELLKAVDGDVGRITGVIVTELAEAGDPTSRELIEDVGEWLGLGLANLAAALDPGTFVIGGGLCDAGELLVAPARKAFARNLTGRGFRPAARDRTGGPRAERRPDRCRRPVPGQQPHAQLGAPQRRTGQRHSKTMGLLDARLRPRPVIVLVVLARQLHDQEHHRRREDGHDTKDRRQRGRRARTSPTSTSAIGPPTAPSQASTVIGSAPARLGGSSGTNAPSSSSAS